jgi:hypothetical protein
MEDHTVGLLERARRTPTGSRLYDTFLEHRSEVLTLVNEHRRVTIAWHRGKGPAYFAHFAENARYPSHRIPFEIEGVTRTNLLERTADALMAEGSEPLREAISLYREDVLALIDEFDDLHEFVDRFAEQPEHA